MDAGPLALFLGSLLAATLLPLSSEALLAGLFLSGEYPAWGLWLAATLGNVAGAQVNWFLGRHLLRFQGRRWFPVSSRAMEQAGKRFRGWGEWSLLLAWVPVIGDPLTFVAGACGVPFPRFSLLVALGKGARYLALLAAL
ncbi:MAG: DedA family protein [Magnetococcales bacterium]|nr:DedA family protein [Magnetococcales bacterium]